LQVTICPCSASGSIRTMTQNPVSQKLSKQAIGWVLFMSPCQATHTELRLRRHIDSAQVYRNEAQVGEAVAASGLKREDIFLSEQITPGNSTLSPRLMIIALDSQPPNASPGRMDTRAHSKASMNRLRSLEEVRTHALWDPQLNRIIMVHAMHRTLRPRCCSECDAEA
jgi:hypothetical protein